MGSIKEHLNNILAETTELLNEHTTSANEFIAVVEIEKEVNAIQILVHEARKVFEQTKDIEKDIEKE